MKEIGLCFIILCLFYDLLLASDFLQLPRWDCLKLFPFFIHCCLYIWNFHHMRHKNEFVHQVVRRYWILSFACFLVFMIFLLHRFHSWSFGFMRFHNTIKFHLLKFLRCFGPFQIHCSGYPWAFCTALDPPWLSPTSFSHSWWYVCILRHSDQWSKYLSNYWHSRVLASRLPIPIFLFSASGQIWSGRVVVWIFVCLPQDHIYPFGGLFQQSKFRESCPRIRQTFVFINIPIIINTFFLYHFQIYMCWPYNTVKWEMFSFDTYSWTLGSMWLRLSQLE